MDVEVSIDDGEWSRALDALLVRVEVATGDASMAAAELIKTYTQANLTERSHSSLTFSPSDWGESPAMVSGALAASIDTAESGPMSAIVGPTDLRYARIQELGGDMHGHPMMVFHKMFRGHLHEFRRVFVHLDERPYLEPATRFAVDSGEVRDIYVEYWAAAIEG